ncbi:unnamed protein product [Bursaphelenchus okinawaensis]|uniref:MOSC domain-containing protein n=1 Tax=Bursaphelenchus okinawaensis TaxID=465554 RepID=A0A811LMU8_9BILA|nr:unnamed protein product [Bursaphelenchus okinawaensis]CAG9127051.1 unnamed protein product [Bursaphelenchus okinawaensis]
MDSKKVFLDNAGSAAISESQKKALSEVLFNNKMLGNPHSNHEAGRRTGVIVESVRSRVLNFFNTSHDNHSVIFTYNTTSALDMVSRTFSYDNEGPKQRQPVIVPLDKITWNQSTLLMFKDSHTSIVGMRNSSNYDQLVVTTFEELNEYIDKMYPVVSSCRHLFVMTAESNFCGRKYDLSIINRIKKKIPSLCVVLDAAAWVPTAPLNLNGIDASYVVFSYYKIFGYPTGLGSIIVKNGDEALLSQSYFGGGSVNFIELNGFGVDRKDDVATRFEHGTVDFYSISALNCGFDDIEAFGGVNAIENHTMALTVRLYGYLTSTTHKNGNPIAIVYGDGWRNSTYDNLHYHQGPIVSFNLLRGDGSVIGYVEVEKMADLYGIDLRAGCMCNQGACSEYLQLSDSERQQLRSAGKECGDEIDSFNGRPAGSLRVSFGRLNTFEDVEWLEMMITTCFINNSPSLYQQFNTFDKPTLGYLTSISLYPLKSGSVLTASSWKTSSGGLKWDRQLMLITKDGVPMTQKQYPRLCSVDCQFSENSVILADRSGTVGALQVDLDEVGKSVNSRVCVKNLSAFDCGDSASNWFHSLGLPAGCRLLKLDNSNEKQNFSNQADYLMISKASIGYLVKMTELTYTEVEERFRANFVVDLGPDSAFLEDKMKKIFIGSTEFEVTDKCSRCHMICIDQKTGRKNPNVLLALRNLRSGTSMTFGVYLKQVSHHEAHVQVGQKVFVTELQ